MAGMRDRLIHDYFGVDLDLVWDVIQEKIPPLTTHSTGAGLDNRSRLDALVGWLTVSGGEKEGVDGSRTTRRRSSAPCSRQTLPDDLRQHTMHIAAGHLGHITG